MFWFALRPQPTHGLLHSMVCRTQLESRSQPPAVPLGLDGGTGLILLV